MERISNDQLFYLAWTTVLLENPRATSFEFMDALEKRLKEQDTEQ